jgi:hypothetical protein
MKILIEIMNRMKILMVIFSVMMRGNPIHVQRLITMAVRRKKKNVINTIAVKWHMQYHLQ